MITRTVFIMLFALTLMSSPIASAQMMGGEMMKGGKGAMEGMGQRHGQMMQMMDQMMEMMQGMMQHIKGTAKDKKTKQEMDEMMKRMDEMRKQHQTMMKDHGMMGRGMMQEAPK